MKAKICVVVPARTQSDAITLLKQGEAQGADLAEIRFDHAEEELDVKSLVSASALPLIATNRLQAEGGQYAGSEDERLDKLAEAVEAGFGYVDLEVSTPSLNSRLGTFTALGARVILSHHDFTSTPSSTDMRSLVTKMRNEGVFACKLVTTARQVVDNLTCLDLVSETAEKMPIICFAMGENGLLSRALSPLFGAFCTYASVQEGLETAPGQVTVMRLRQIQELLGG